MLASTLPAVVPPALPAPVEFSLGDFVSTFGESLLDAVREQNPPVYNGQPHPGRDRVMDGLSRRPFDPQREVVQACTALLIDADDPACKHRDRDRQTDRLRHRSISSCSDHGFVRPHASL